MDEVKQVIVIRKDLNMRKGKIAAQAAHASMKVLLDKFYNSSYSIVNGNNKNNSRFIKYTLIVSKNSALNKWLNGIFTKIVVYVESESELLNLNSKAEELGIKTALIQDSGKTEFHGNPTYTCLAIGPDWSEKIDKITSGLPLL
jgi:peptidyl-tRNA hydrolase, PTH2 family